MLFKNGSVSKGSLTLLFKNFYFSQSSFKLLSEDKDDATLSKYATVSYVPASTTGESAHFLFTKISGSDINEQTSLPITQYIQLELTDIFGKVYKQRIPVQIQPM